ncbi:hypothetical protein EXIGLDRAFT_783163, partial [Exidia glandulosa HHB12029]
PAPAPASSTLSSRAYLLLDDNHVVHNPFATPPKPKSRTKSRAKRERSSSPDDDDDVDSFFPPIRPTNVLAPKDTPATRARKRLRGEPVDPSPDKLSRTRSFARVQSESAPAPRPAFFTSQPHQAPSKDEHDPEEDDVLAESPAKPDPKDFRPLFDSPQKGAGGKLVRSKTMPAGGLFARAPSRSNGNLSDNELDHGPTPSSLHRKQTNGTASPQPDSEPSKLLRRTATLPTTTTPSAPAPAPARGNGHGKKRALEALAEDPAEDEDHDSPIAGPSTARPFAGMALLPPSPPPVKASWEPRKAKPKAGASSHARYTKKPRLQEDKEQEEDSKSDNDGFEMREVQWRSHGRLLLDQPQAEPEDDLLDEWEKEMHLRRSRTAQLHDEGAVDEDEPRVRVDVASDMLSVLSLAQSPVKTRRSEQRVLRDLLLPDGTSWVGGRGEDVFAAGEEDEGKEEDDDDWADEGVRWDEGEL